MKATSFCAIGGVRKEFNEEIPTLRLPAKMRFKYSGLPAGSPEIEWNFIAIALGKNEMHRW